MYKLKQMYRTQCEFFKERLDANIRILDLEIEMKEEDVIKFNNKDKLTLLEKYSCK